MYYLTKPPVPPWSGTTEVVTPDDDDSKFPHSVEEQALMNSSLPRSRLVIDEAKELSGKENRNQPQR